jgi:proteasome component ECM29
MADQPAPSAAAAPDAAEQTDAERLDALDRMLTRLALADDARLAPVLARVLPYAITSLASPAPAVRKLVSAPDRASSSSSSRLPDLNFNACHG